MLEIYEGAGWSRPATDIAVDHILPRKHPMFNLAGKAYPLAIQHGSWGQNPYGIVWDE